MNETKEVKNITEKDLTVIGIGIVKAGETVKVPVGFHNANFEIVKKGDTEKEVAKDIKNTKEK